MTANGIEVFSTCPSSALSDPEVYLQEVAQVARWSEEAGCRGILVYSDNSLADPWLVSQIIIENTAELAPLVAVQPVYMHPYSIAKMITSLGMLHGRRVYLNLVAGGFTNDLAALDDRTPHDKRYARLVEYTTIIKELLANDGPFTYNGEFYTVDKLKLTPPLAPKLVPGIFVSGSSEAGLAAARALGATAVKYPKPPGEEEPALDEETNYGVRVGIIARGDEEAAWEVAHARFPEDRRGQLTHHLAMKTSDSVWHQQLSRIDTESERVPYWLIPFQNYKTFCPYLVGSYERVAEELARYVGMGYRTFILDIPPSREELSHINVVFKLVAQAVK